MKLITLLVISDEVIAGLGLKHLLASEEGYEVKGEVDSRNAVEQAVSLRPDVVVILADATHQGCAQLIGSLRKAVPRSAVVILGRETHHSYVGTLLAAGALGYVLPRAMPRELFSAIRAAAYGRRYIDPNLNEELFELLAHRATGGTKILSQREQQVIQMLAYGHTLKEIASRLNISRKSIETYRARSREKLGLRTRADIVRYALQTGMLNVEMKQAS